MSVSFEKLLEKYHFRVMFVSNSRGVNIVLFISIVKKTQMTEFGSSTKTQS